MTIKKNDGDRELRPIQLHDRPSNSGPEFTIKSGAFGGEYSTTRGDLADSFVDESQIGT